MDDICVSLVTACILFKTCFHNLFCRLLPGDEPDTGEMLYPHVGFVNPSHPIHPRGLLMFMKTKMRCEMDNEEEFLAHKGGFWDQVILAIKFFRQKVCLVHFLHQFICQLFHDFHPSICQPIHLSTHPSPIHPSISSHPSIHPIIHSFTHIV